MDIFPIKTEADYQRAMNEIDRLWGAEIDTLDGDRLDILIDLVSAYEARHHPIDPPDPVEAILFRMQQMGLTRKDLEPMLGGRGRVSEVLSRRRGLSITMIRELHSRLNISLESLVLGENQPTA